MPCLVRQIPLNGTTPVCADRQADSLSDATRFEDWSGVYAVFATWNGRRVVGLSHHLDRLEDSARIAGFPVALDRTALRASLGKFIDESGFAEVRARVSISPAGMTVLMSIEPYPGPPVELRTSGVRCETVVHAARDNPHAKRTQWILERSGLVTFRKQEVYETLIVNQAGQVLEGASSNFYVVLDGPVLKTAEEGVLRGIARSIVLAVASDMAEIQRAAPVTTDLARCREAFLSSASRGVVPVTRINADNVGDGRPGPVTREIIERFDRRAREMEEKL
jgi:branched-subunit amino acid aminotransferase/4-amino-4-deoxychorismate lyase